MIDAPLKTLILNLKNYPEVLGENSVRFAQAAEKGVKGLDVELIVAPPTPMLGLVASKVMVRVFSQDVSSQDGDKTTGAILAESVKAAGCSGTLLNHSESRKQPREIEELVPRLDRAGLEVCICSQTPAESVEMARLEPNYLAIEPPELIGTGVAVSRARPGLIEKTVSAVKETGFKGRILCGAGIVSGDDVARAVELGADGVLVASSAVKATDWESKVRELAGSLK